MKFAGVNTQVKVSVGSEIASSFKKACVSSNISMAAVLSQFMADYSKSLVKLKVKPDYSTRRRRRSAIKEIIVCLEEMKAWEESVLENTPENLQSSTSYYATEEAISTLEEAISALESF